jgi:hypothetical protein
MTEIFRQIIAGVTGAIVLGVLVRLSDYVFWFNVCIAGAVGLGVYFSIPRKQEAHEIELAPGVTQGQVDAAVGRVEEYILKFKKILRMASDRDIRAYIMDITETLGRIAQHFRHDPRDMNISSTPQFLDQYLVRSHDLVYQYIRLANMSLDAAQTDQLTSARETIAQVQSGFKAYYQQCLQNDFIDLEVESETLKSIIEMELPHIEEERIQK